jgi:hypothetical protein
MLVVKKSLLKHPVKFLNVLPATLKPLYAFDIKVSGLIMWFLSN